MDRDSRTTRTLWTFGIAVYACLCARYALAQGCEPIRFTTPVNLGGQGEAFQRSHEWQLTLAFRRLHSDQWFIGTEDKSSLAPGGESPVFDINTFVGDVAYGITDRTRVRLSVPFSTGSLSRVWPDQSHAIPPCPNSRWIRYVRPSTAGSDASSGSSI